MTNGMGCSTASSRSARLASGRSGHTGAPVPRSLSGAPSSVRRMRASRGCTPGAAGDTGASHRGSRDRVVVPFVMEQEIIRRLLPTASEELDRGQPRARPCVPGFPGSAARPGYGSAGNGYASSNAGVGRESRDCTSLSYHKILF